MSRIARLVVLSVSILSVVSVAAQSPGLSPIHAAAGTVVTFYLQTRLNPATPNVIDSLPRGTTVSVKLLRTIDSAVDRDGAEFDGILAAPLLSDKNEVILPANSAVRGLFALLRSASHPDGFRYELLVTKIKRDGKVYELTASATPSLSDRKD
ncbi:MAG TPA: hypothetical protein VMJ35_06215 [Dongiaceae bacterium]|nr:hypothetical protein [Dongiaceae bacterium]